MMTDVLDPTTAIVLVALIIIVRLGWLHVRDMED